jgi:hypothetical protein
MTLFGSMSMSAAELLLRRAALALLELSAKADAERRAALCGTRADWNFENVPVEREGK